LLDVLINPGNLDDMALSVDHTVSYSRRQNSFGFLVFLEMLTTLKDIPNKSGLTEMSTRNIKIIMFLGSKVRLVRKADSLTAIYEPIV
jgi:hypothetical protein